MRVHRTDTAQQHLDAIYRYIAQDSPAYATRMVDRIIYLIKPDQIDVLAVLHGARKIPGSQ